MGDGFIVVGLGNVGLYVLWDLARHGHEVVGLDSRFAAVERARSMGLDAEVGDAAAVGKLAAKMGGVDAIVTALPGSIAYGVVEGLVREGHNIVDVSFFPEDPWPLGRVAKRNRSTVVVDAGVAPGLSNYLVALGADETGARSARIYVGGVSRDPLPPLGISATWSTEDLIEEYLRPARYIEAATVKTVNPLESQPGQVEVPGVGVMEYFPTDGLRTLLKTYSTMDFMAEYTLRWPGHLAAMRTLAAIGLLDPTRIPVEGCPVSPKGFLASLFQYKYRGVRDLVVLLVELGREGGAAKRYRVIVEADEAWSAMAKATGSFQSVVAELLSIGVLERGLVVPEMIGSDKELAGIVSRRLESRGIRVVEE